MLMRLLRQISYAIKNHACLSLGLYGIRELASGPLLDIEVDQSVKLQLWERKENSHSDSDLLSVTKSLVC